MRDSYRKSDKSLDRGIDDFHLRKEVFSEVRNRLKRSHKVRLFEVGCGQGRLLLDLLSKFPSLQLDGINVSKKHGLKLQKDFRKRAEEWNIPISQTVRLPRLTIGSVTKLPFKNNTFDLIVSQVTFIHVVNKAKGIEEITRVLKPNGVAIISIGSYSIRRKRGHGMPQFYKNLRDKIGNDLNPRFLVKDGDHFLPFSKTIQLMNNGSVTVSLSSDSFTSETQRGKAYWLIIHKKRNTKVTLPFKYLEKDSQELTDLYAKKNPVNWGVIDLYELSTGSNHSSKVAR